MLPMPTDAFTTARLQRGAEHLHLLGARDRRTARRGRQSYRRNDNRPRRAGRIPKPDAGGTARSRWRRIPASHPGGGSIMNAILPARDRERLVRVLGMLGSAHDGEVLAAALAAHGLTWQE